MIVTGDTLSTAAVSSTLKLPKKRNSTVIDIVEALKKSLEARKPPTTAPTAACSGEDEEAAEGVAEQPKRKRAARKVKTA